MKSHAPTSAERTARDAFEHWFSDEGKTPRSIERSGDGYKLMQAQAAWWAWEAAWNRRAAMQPAEPVAKVVSAYGDPEAFGEREIIALADLRDIPYGTMLYRAAPDRAPSNVQKVHISTGNLIEDRAPSIAPAYDPTKLRTLVKWFQAGKLPENLVWNVQVTAEVLRNALAAPSIDSAAMVFEQAAQRCDQQADGTNGAYRTACLECANSVREMRDSIVASIDSAADDPMYEALFNFAIKVAATDPHSPSALAGLVADANTTMEHYPLIVADSAADARKGCRDAFNLILNCRKLMTEKQMDKAANWVIACELSAVGSTTAMAICREADIDPQAYTMQKLAGAAP